MLHLLHHHLLHPQPHGGEVYALPFVELLEHQVARLAVVGRFVGAVLPAVFLGGLHAQAHHRLGTVGIGCAWHILAQSRHLADDAPQASRQGDGVVAVVLRHEPHQPLVVGEERLHREGPVHLGNHRVAVAHGCAQLHLQAVAGHDARLSHRQPVGIDEEHRVAAHQLARQHHVVALGAGVARLGGVASQHGHVDVGHRRVAQHRVQPCGLQPSQFLL